MIEVTGEMIDVFWAAHDDPEDGGDESGLAAVLALVERDRKAAAKQEWDQLRGCPSTSREGDWVCERLEDHDGPHRALRYYVEWPEVDFQPSYGTGCRCACLGEGTPEHAPGAICLRPKDSRQ